MEAFSLLKYWRSSVGGSAAAAATTTITDSTAASRATAETVVPAAADSPYSSDGEDGPYFDLEFAVPDQESDADEGPPPPQTENYQKGQVTENEDETESGSEDISVHGNDDDDNEEEDGEGELKFSLTTGSECTDESAVAVSPSDELFFKGNLVPIDPSSILLNGSSEEINSKLPVFLVKSATKFRVLLLKLKKSKSSNGDGNNPENDGAASGKKESRGKFMAVKFKVEEGPLVSLFTRDTSSKENGHGGKGLKINVEDNNNISDSDDRKLAKEVMQKYLKMVKPFYVRVSKRYVEKLKFSGQGGGVSRSSTPAAGEGVSVAARGNARAKLNGNNLQAGLKVVRKHLGKSRSASAAVAAAPPGKTSSNRRDDSLLQVQDGIQGAIMHCKRSFNASRELESSSILCRSVSDPSVIIPKASSSSSSSSTSSFCGEANNKV